MKFRECSYGASVKFESMDEYFESRAYANARGYDGELETLRGRVTYLEEVIGRLLRHLPIDLEQLSDVADGYDRELEEIEE